MIDMAGAKLKKSDLEGIFNDLTNDSVLVNTDMIGFKLFIEGYSGWLQPPNFSVDQVYMNGVHPSGLGLVIVGNRAATGMIISENVDTPSIIEQIVNYT